jgi:hypothetical protein
VSGIDLERMKMLMCCVMVRFFARFERPTYTFIDYIREISVHSLLLIPSSVSVRWLSYTLAMLHR